MKRRAILQGLLLLALGAPAAAACSPTVLIAGGDGTAGSSASTSSNGGGSTTLSSTSSSSSSGTPASSSSGGVCPGDDCAFGNGGYAFAYADSSPPGTGTSTATLAADGSLCISGNIMALPADPTPEDYAADWGCGLGINLDQATDGGLGGGYTLTGTGVTIDINAVPGCIGVANIHVILDQQGAVPKYCAPLTPGVEIPWGHFNTACWDPPSGVALSGPPTSQSIQVQFVTTATECAYTDFCITAISL